MWGTKYAEAPTYSRGESQELLVGGAIIILKNMSSSMGRMTSHIYYGNLWKIKVMFETTNQIGTSISPTNTSMGQVIYPNPAMKPAAENTRNLWSLGSLQPRNNFCWTRTLASKRNKYN